MTPILLVGMDREIQERADSVLVAQGLGPVARIRDGEQVPLYLAENPCDLVLLDIGRAGHRDIDLIGRITAGHPGITVVAISQADEAAAAISCIHQGAYDYLVKPVTDERLMDLIRRALGLRRARQAPSSGCAGGPAEAFAPIITDDPGMREVFAYAEAVARSGQPLLITGETGTGKDLLARAVHQLSGNPGDYVAVNIAGMDDAMLSDSLFGHRKGAFTGATDLRPGLVLGASSGTLFLDEIGELDPVSQVKLLRLLQDGDYFPLGCDRPKRSTARIIAATNADLQQLQAGGRFRRDLFYRLQTHILAIPPLRSRPRDLPLLMDHFAALAAADLGRPPVVVPAEAAELLAGYAFPGNVRELRSLMYDALARTPLGAPLSLMPFRKAMAMDAPGKALVAPTTGMQFPATLPSLAEVQRLLVNEALARSQGNQAVAASWLGISRQAIHKRLRS
jgi:DNA-binding NtrC family response regulator